MVGDGKTVQFLVSFSIFQYYTAVAWVIVLENEQAGVKAYPLHTCKQDENDFFVFV